MPTARKAAVIDGLTEQFSRSQLTILTDYRGLSVSDVQGFRAALRLLGAEFHIAKNTLARIAAKQAGIDGLDDLLVGPTALVLAYGDIVGVSKVVNDFARSSRILTVQAGVMNQQVLAPRDIDAIASLPPREELVGRLVGLLASPMARTVGVLGGPSRSMVYLLNAKAQEAGGDATEPAAAD